MNTNHNRIKVSDLETNQPDKILTTNSEGELEFSNLNSIKNNSHNGLDYTQEGKALDARQGKVLKDLIDTKIDKVFGTSQANKLLGTDTHGDLKLYSMATYPAPFWGGGVSTLLPNSTSSLIIKGAFFTPSITASITGQTVNYITFINDNEIHINITTGSSEGNFPLTLNNGTSITFNNVLLISWGTVFKPEKLDWEALSGNLDLSEGDSAYIQAFNSSSNARWSKLFDYTKNFIVSFDFSISPLATIYSGNYQHPNVSLVKSSNNVPLFTMNVRMGPNYHNLTGIELYSEDYGWRDKVIDYYTISLEYSLQNFTESLKNTFAKSYMFKWFEGIMYIYINGQLKNTFSEAVTEDLKLNLNLSLFNIKNIKYIEIL